jgi:hypothetical protein
MAEIFIRYVDPDGYSVHTPWDDEQPLPEGAEIIPRMPDPINPGEEWDGTQFSVPAEIEQKVIEASSLAQGSKSSGGRAYAAKPGRG